jgi:hypothetical protein
MKIVRAVGVFRRYDEDGFRLNLPPAPSLPAFVRRSICNPHRFALVYSSRSSALRCCLHVQSANCIGAVGSNAGAFDVGMNG